MSYEPKTHTITLSHKTIWCERMISNPSQKNSDQFCLEQALKSRNHLRVETTLTHPNIQAKPMPHKKARNVKKSTQLVYIQHQKCCVMYIET